MDVYLRREHTKNYWTDRANFLQSSDMSADFDITPSVTPQKSTTISTSVTDSKESHEAQKLIGEEFKETTSVPGKLYFEYFKAAGWTWVLVSLLAYALFQVFAILANVW
ncbi:unnamed protein product, partial [Allacma fusca]